MLKVVVIRKEPFEVQELTNVTQITVSDVGGVAMLTINYGRDLTQTFNTDFYIIQILLS